MALTGSFTPLPSSPLLAFVQSQSGQKVTKCYQCGRCSASCPVAYEMDLVPRQVMRAVQLGLREEVMKSSTIWLCVHCLTCSVRCPLEIEVSKVMEALRMLATAEKSKAAQRDIALFHKIFLRIVLRLGRVHELTLGGLFNIFSRHFFHSFNLLPAMLRRRKLPLLPSRSKGAAELRGIFARAARAELKPPPKEREEP